MSRRNGPEPFFRSDRGLWYVQIGSKQHNLGRDEAEARRRWHALMAQPEPVPRAANGSPLVVAVIDEFLTWNESHRAPRTLRWYKEYMTSFVASLSAPETFPVSDLKPHHIERWVTSHTTWGPSYRHGAFRAMQRCFRWAEKQGYIDLSPVRHLDKPTPQRREQVISPDEYRTILEYYEENDPFHDLLEFVWETGARPQEARIVAARHYRNEKTRLELPPEEAKGKRWRVIYLSRRADAIVSRLARERPEGPLFLNEHGNPWSTFATNCRFMRLEKKLGVKYALYAFRHSYCQRLLEAGMDSVTVAALLGHANANMLNRVYSHMDKARDFLAEQLKQMEGGGDAV